MSLDLDDDRRQRTTVVILGTAAMAALLLLAASAIPFRAADSPVPAPVEVEAGLVELPAPAPPPSQPAPQPKPVKLPPTRHRPAAEPRPASRPQPAAPPPPSASTAPPPPSASTAPPPPAAAASLSGGTGGARAIIRPAPVIPPELRHHAINLVAVVRFAVAADGSATAELEQATPDLRLNQILLDTFRRWRFFPATRHGQPVASTVTLRVPVRVE